MIIDFDTHILPRDSYDYVEGPLASKRPFFKFDGNGFLSHVDFPGSPPQVPGSTPLSPPGTGWNYKGMSHLEARLEDFDRMGIEKQVLFPQFTAMLFNYLIEPELAAAMAHSYNLAILNLVNKYPDRLIGAALVALQDPGGAISEIEWAKKNGFRAILLDKVFPVTSHPYSDPIGQHKELWPFFKRAAELRMSVLLHTIQHGHRLNNLMTFQHDGLEILTPNEGVLSLASLVTSGLFDEYPDLNVVYTEAGTAFIKPLVERLDESFNRSVLDYDAEDAATRKWRIDGPNFGIAKARVSKDIYVAKNRQPASHYFRKNIHFTIETEEPELADAVEFLGASQFLFATDYPHDDAGGRMKTKDVELLRKNDRIPESQKEDIRWKNASRLLAEV